MRCESCESALRFRTIRMRLRTLKPLLRLAFRGIRTIRKGHDSNARMAEPPPSD